MCAINHIYHVINKTQTHRRPCMESLFSSPQEQNCSDPRAGRKPAHQSVLVWTAFMIFKIKLQSTRKSQARPPFQGKKLTRGVTCK